MSATLIKPPLQFAERLRAARKRARLTLRALSAQVGVSAQALSKYEHGQDMPSSDVLMRLAQALNVEVEWLLRPAPPIALSMPKYRAHRTRLTAKARAALIEQVREWLERYFAIEAILGRSIPFDSRRVRQRIRSVAEAENAAEALREAWGLGMDAIPNLSVTLEYHGVYVGEVGGADGFDALMLWADETKPVMVVRKGMPGDRQRFSLAHELGHVVLDMPTEWEDREVEAAASRFAGALLVPRTVVVQELGERRSHLSIGELQALKQRYGLSMAGWIHRAQDVGVVSTQAAKRMWQRVRAQGWHKQEPGAAYPPEQPGRMQQLVLQALVEGAISERRAKELLGMPLWETLEVANTNEALSAAVPA